MLSPRRYAPHRQRRLRSATLYPTDNRQTPQISRPEFVWATGSVCIIEQRTDFVHHKDDLLRKEFEKWAVLTCTNNRAVINQKKGADVGMDGVAYFEVLWLVERVSSVGIRNSGRSEWTEFCLFGHKRGQHAYQSDVEIHVLAKKGLFSFIAVQFPAAEIP